MNRAFLALAILALALTAILGWGWLHQPPSNQEMLANLAKAKDYALAAHSVHGWPWWSPNYMQGTSLAPVFTTAFTSLWLYLWSLPFGDFIGPKISGLVCVIAAALGMFAFAKRLSDSNWTAFLCGILYLFLPGIFVRLGYVEHMNVVCTFVILPLVFWGILALLEKPSAFTALGCAGALAALVITYAKIAILSLPVLALFTACIWWWRGRGRIPAIHLLLLTCASFLFLAVVPNLPMMREIHFMTLFRLSPFEGWQMAFSTKSALLWLDRDGILSKGMPDWFAPSTAKGSHYLGMIPAIIIGVIFLFRKNALYASKSGSLMRLFIALGLFAHWLSFGPHSVIGGHFEFLRYAQNISNFTIPLAWVLLCVQAWLIFLVFPRNLPRRIFFSICACAAYLLIPGFRLIEYFPLFYSDIRAPHDFYQTTGIFCIAVVSGIGASLLLTEIHRVRTRIMLITIAIILMVVDISPYFQPFFKSQLGADVFKDFLKTQNYLATHNLPGRVFPCSGRYFYLLTPLLSGRQLTSEAFNSYLCQRGMAEMLAISTNSPDHFRTFLDITGVAYLLLDKNDPDTPKEYQQFLRGLLPVADENENFALLENKNTLAPAFLAVDFVQTKTAGTNVANAALTLAKYNVATVQIAAPLATEDIGGLAGSLTDSNMKLSEKAEHADHPSFAKATEVAPRNKNYSQIIIKPSPGKGWLTVPEAYHPDWTALCNGAPLEVHRTFDGLFGVYVDGSQSPVEFLFRQPWWYNACAWLGAFSWIAYGAFFLLVFSPFCPQRLKQRISAVSFHGSASASLPYFFVPHAKVTRPLIIIPTYNEADTLPNLLEMIWNTIDSISVLIIDDNSSDGTASHVENHPKYGQNLYLFKRKAKLGLGSAYREGFQWALEKGFDACIEMDADLSHNPADIPKFIHALNAGYDLAVGSRYLGGVRVIDWPEHRLLLSTGASRYVRFLTGMPLSDATSGFKAVRSGALKSLDWKNFKAEGYGFQIELHYFLWKNGCKITEIPIVFTERRKGKTKMTVGIALEAALRVIQLAFRRTKK